MVLPKDDAEAALPEFYTELQQTEDEMKRFPDGFRWALRAELPPGRGIVAGSNMIIFTPLA